MKRFALIVSLLLLVSVFWGLASPVSKISLQDMPPLTLLFLRFSIAAILILPAFLKTKRDFQGDFWRLIGFSLLMFGNVFFFILGVNLTSAAVATALYAAAPLLVVIFSRIFYQKKISILKISGVLTGLLGVLLIIFLPVLVQEETPLGSIKGNLIILLAVLSFSFYTLFSQKILQKHSPLLVSSLSIFVTTFLSLPLAFFELSRQELALTTKSLLGVLYLGIFATVGSFFLYQKLIKLSSPLQASLFLYLQVIVSALGAVVLIGEKLTTAFYFGSAIALTGVFLTTTLSYFKIKRL